MVLRVYYINLDVQSIERTYGFGPSEVSLKLGTPDVSHWGHYSLFCKS